MLILEPPPDLLERWFPGRHARNLGRLDGGYMNDVFRIATDEGDFVLRVCLPETTLEMVLWEHELLDFLGPRVAEVPAPVPAPGGETAVLYGGRVASVFPYIEGEHPNRHRRQHRIATGHTLGRIHHHVNRWWNWPDARPRLAFAPEAPEDLDPPPADVPRLLDRHLEILPPALEELRWRRLPEQPVHGDYYEGNLRVVDDRVVGVFDWDEARLDWRACDVADATWSFSRNAWNDRFDPETAGEFLDAYREGGGEVTEAERAVLVLLMRARRLWEALYEVGAWHRGDEIDWYYLAANARALEHLDGVEAL